MEKLPNHRLDQLLREAFPTVEVSSDFTLQLWRKLMKEPLPTFWRVPIAAVATAAVFGIAAGLWNSGNTRSAFAQVERLDLFGNAPHDTLAGTVLREIGGENV